MNEVVTRDQQMAVAATGVTPMQMLQIAVQQGADLDKLQKLMDLQERWEKNEARKAFVAALAAFKSDPPEVHKNKQVSFDTSKGRTEYKHATLDEVSSTIGKALSTHGLSHRWDVEQKDGIIKVTCVLTHAMGHSESVPMEGVADQSGGKNSIQAIGSTVTYLQRYTLLAATGMAVKDQDDDGRGGAEPAKSATKTPAKISEEVFESFKKKIQDSVTKEAAKAEWLKSLAICKDLGDVESAENLKAIMLQHAAVLDEAAASQAKAA